MSLLTSMLQRRTSVCWERTIVRRTAVCAAIRPTHSSAAVPPVTSMYRPTETLDLADSARSVRLLLYNLVVPVNY